MLDPELLWLNSDDRGIFIDPEEAIAVLNTANLGVEPLYMAATDVWDSRSGIERRAPEGFRMPTPGLCPYRFGANGAKNSR